MNSGPTTAMGGYEIPTHRVIRGRLQPPPSKSITQRALNLALLSRRPVIIEHPLLAEDTELFLAALNTLGLESDLREDRLTLRPTDPPDGAEIWCGNNGTMLRFLTAALSSLPGEWRLMGSKRLHERTVGPLVEALRTLGARIEYMESEGFAPLLISGGQLDGGAVELDASLSSQFASALLMVATQARSSLLLRLDSPVSVPYLDLTGEILESWGGQIEAQRDSKTFRVEPSPLSLDRFVVEGDYSAAAYPAAAAVLTGGNVLLERLGRDSAQGDRRFLEILASMGAQVEWRESGVEVRAGLALSGLEVDLADMPDQVPTLAALAPFASGRTVIRNVGHLRIKESDRLAAMSSELVRLGAAVVERRDGLEIEGSWSGNRVPDDRVVVATHGDHRVAMSLAVCGLRRPGVVVDTPEVVAKSYPGFWKDLDELLDS